MVSEKLIINKTIYLCEECGMGYDEEKIAKACETYCKETNSCSFEITKKQHIGLKKTIFCCKIKTKKKVKKILITEIQYLLII